MFWTFPALVSFWAAIFETFSYICDKKTKEQPDPVIAIFGVAPLEVSLLEVQADALLFFFVITSTKNNSATVKI